MKMHRLPLILILAFFTGSAMAQRNPVKTTENPNRVINADFTRVKGPLNTMFNECVGAGRANEGLRADWQQQLAYVRKECGFRYIRMHGLLSDDMGVYKEDRDGNPQYNYMYIDVLFDYLQSIGMKPFVELGFMPSALASGNRTIFWWHGNVTPPKDYGKWAELIRNLTRHWTERYGADEVKTWYFEVWNEPNLTPGFWTGTQDEYFKLYTYAANAVKSVNPGYRVGGPGTAGAAWEPEMIRFCKENNVPLDFISTHSYGVQQGYLDEYGQTGTVLDGNPMSVSGDVLQSRREIASSAMPGLELHYTEWSASYTPSDPIHDSYHEAAYILQKIKQVGNAASSMSYWVFTDIFEEAGPRFEPFHGGSACRPSRAAGLGASRFPSASRPRRGRPLPSRGGREGPGGCAFPSPLRLPPSGAGVVRRPPLPQGGAGRGGGGGGLVGGGCGVFFVGFFLSLVFVWGGGGIFF